MQEKVSESHFACLTGVSGTAASIGLYTTRAACFHLKSRRPDFPWPCCLDTVMSAHHGHLLSTPSCSLCCRIGHLISFIKQVSHMHCPATPTTRCALPRNCNMPARFYQTIAVPSFPCFSKAVLGSSNTLRPGSLSVPEHLVEAIAP